MARHGESKHFKRSAVTRAIVIPRKKYAYYVRPFPGKHNVSESIALLGLIRDLMKIANNAKEARNLIKNGEVKVDGKQIREEKYAVGFGDIVEIKGDGFLVSLDGNGRMVLVKNELEHDLKRLKVIRKSKFTGGKTVLGFNDGRNLIVKDDSAQINDTVLLNLSKMELEKILPFEQGKNVMIFKGKNAGLSGKIVKITGDSVELEKDGEKILASLKSCFVV